jgi:Spy/CpxP family protein refolding chaperone
MMTGRMDKMIDMCLRHAEAIGLTDEQIGKIRRLHREVRKKEARFRADLTIANIDRREIMEVKDFDPGKASSAVKKIEEIKTAHQLEMLKAMKEIRSMLTDEQFKKMNTLMSMRIHR